MLVFLRKSIISVIMILCVFCIVNSSSGVSELESNRGVAMRIANSEDALISLPDVINLDITVLRQTIRYYKVHTEYITEKIKDNIDPTKTLVIKTPVEVKKLVKTEKIIAITDIQDNLVIKNNMGNIIQLEKIEFKNPILQAGLSNVSLGIGETLDNISINSNGNDSDILNNIIDTEKEKPDATLYFRWEKGNSVIYKDVAINVTIQDEGLEEVID